MKNLLLVAFLLLLISCENNSKPEVEKPDQIEITYFFHSGNSALIKWEKSTDPYFNAYELFKSTSPDMTNREKLIRIENVEQTKFESLNINSYQNLYYQIDLIGANDSRSSSEVYHASTYPVVVFESEKSGLNGSKYDLLMMDLSGTNKTTLDTSSSKKFLVSEFSSDGSQIIYESVEANKYLDVKILNLKTGGHKTFGFQEEYDYWPKFGEKSTGIYFSGSPEWSRRIYTTEYYGSVINEVTPPTNDLHVFDYFAFSPDYTKLFFGSGNKLYMTNKTNGENYSDTYQKLFESNNSLEVTFNISKDGKKILWSHINDEISNSEIYIIDIDKTVTTLSGLLYPIFGNSSNEIYCQKANTGIIKTNINTGSEITLTNSPNDKPMALTPDGQKILFISERDGNKEIYIMNIDGSNQINLTNSQEDEYNLIVQPK